jgi:hypothetical protein
VQTADPYRAARLTSCETTYDDAYVVWAHANRRCAEALQAWRAATSDDRDEAYRGYLLRLDNEEAAAEQLADLHDTCGS